MPVQQAEVRADLNYLADPQIELHLHDGNFEHPDTLLNLTADTAALIGRQLRAGSFGDLQSQEIFRVLVYGVESEYVEQVRIAIQSGVDQALSGIEIANSVSMMHSNWDDRIPELLAVFRR